MRKTLYFLCVAGLIFNSCRNNEPDPEPDPGQYVDTCGANTGRLAVETRRNGSNALEGGTEVFVYINHQDFLDNRYLSYAVVNASGRVDMGCYNFGNYYIYAQKHIGGQLWKGYEPFQVQTGRDFVVTVELFQP